VGIRKVKIQILDALLRLRQAALHPALIDRSRRQPTVYVPTCLVP
jgi:SNF2 family DNA or RNA helicase